VLLAIYAAGIGEDIVRSSDVALSLVLRGRHLADL